MTIRTFLEMVDDELHIDIRDVDLDGEMTLEILGRLYMAWSRVCSSLKGNIS